MTLTLHTSQVHCYGSHNAVLSTCPLLSWQK